MRRRDFIAGLGGAAAWPVVARAQQPALSVVAFIYPGSGDALGDLVRAFRKGLSESGYVEGRNVMVEDHRLDNQFDRLPALMADLVSRRWP
jgi:putative tryptophan/tyrosine transport system substrate-binding protein